MDASGAVRDAVHRWTHHHVVMTRGLEELVICGPRRWWLGRVYVYHRSHRHASWRRLTPNEFRESFPTVKDVSPWSPT